MLFENDRGPSEKRGVPHHNTNNLVAVDKLLSDRIEQSVVHVVVVTLGQNHLPAEEDPSAYTTYFGAETVGFVPICPIAPALLGLEVRLDGAMDHRKRSAGEPANGNISDRDDRVSIPEEDDVSPMECRRHGLGDDDHDGLRGMGKD